MDLVDPQRRPSLHLEVVGQQSECPHQQPHGGELQPIAHQLDHKCNHPVAGMMVRRSHRVRFLRYQIIHWTSSVVTQPYPTAERSIFPATISSRSISISTT